MGPDSVYLHRSLTNVHPSAETIEKIEKLREAARYYGDAIFDLVPSTAERSIAVRALEESVMWATKTLCLAEEA